MLLSNFVCCFQMKLFKWCKHSHFLKCNWKSENLVYLIFYSWRSFWYSHTIVDVMVNLIALQIVVRYVKLFPVWIWNLSFCHLIKSKSILISFIEYVTTVCYIDRFVWFYVSNIKKKEDLAFVYKCINLQKCELNGRRPPIRIFLMNATTSTT